MVELSSVTLDSRRDRNLIVIITPHFPPSSEVGARRVGAVVAALAAQGYQILVVSATEARNAPIVGVAGLSEIDSNSISVLRTALPSPLLLSRLVVAKRWFGRLWRKIFGNGPNTAEKSATARSAGSWGDSGGCGRNAW